MKRRRRRRRESRERSHIDADTLPAPPNRLHPARRRRRLSTGSTGDVTALPPQPLWRTPTAAVSEHVFCKRTRVRPAGSAGSGASASSFPASPVRSKHRRVEQPFPIASH